MQGLELVLARVASTVASSVVRSVLAKVTPGRGAGLVTDPVRPSPKPAGPEKLAQVLGGRIAGRYAALPEHERLAAVAAVEDSFTSSGALDADRLFSADLDPVRLSAELRRPVTDLAPRAQDLYAELLELCCEHLVDQLTAHPSFAARAAVEQTRRTGRLLRQPEEVGAQAPPVSAFEARYAGFIAGTHHRLELFGVTLGGRRRAEWPLDTAYLSLSVSGDERHAPRPERMPEGQTSVRVEQALADCHRLLLRGPAGSGKSTLLQWLALNAARRSFGSELADWNRCVPFVLRLRSFHGPGGLPLPEDFLSAAGVPLRAPDGWVQKLLLAGRALVLVDGVDEVPSRMRDRTETWLKALVTAFPDARYVVTTRPSAVPEDWLAALEFSAHTLLPMDREGIRTFVRHWHDAARQEYGADTEREPLDRYEASLSEALTTRRDLGRLATNPLMSALLCALNSDRRMHLPRARKELYDAALDMLLVRRDSERDIAPVEGVVLSREEQTALLQRLAYWMIRNGQVEAAQDEVVAMLDEWLAAMPQVRDQGSAERIFSHLLIRSGLLREPVPGYVDFVHRTFQDYLGAKAAVEDRDFGMLVRHAHDDQWDDVVRMAVGHSRMAERGRLLRRLMRRADKVRRHRERLVLLAAASLEHAAELEPEVREEVQRRAAELVPPRSAAQADELAKVGEVVVELLPGPECLDEATAAAVVRTAALVGGPVALVHIARFRQDTRFEVCRQLSHAWRRFDTEEYADAVLSAATLGEAFLHVATQEQATALERLPQIEQFHLDGPLGVPEAIAGRTGTRMLFLNRDPFLDDLSPLAGLTSLQLFGIDGCPNVVDLTPVRQLPITRLHIYDASPRLSLTPVAGLTDLELLTLDYAPEGLRSVADLPAGPGLTRLGLFLRARHVRLDGLSRWRRLNWLSVAGPDHVEQLARQGEVLGIAELQIVSAHEIPADTLVRHQDLTTLTLYDSGFARGTAPLGDLPELRMLNLTNCSGPVDLTPLAELPDLVVRFTPGTELRGTDRFPPERLVQLRH
ncbi:MULTISPECIES: NACHT domain-containing protein [unclassified Streptomyces]|uniref:NACHT domain-containing protein n=1 Tax=unclassified Streptomyces TaxID=2593676 RepID=UPI003D718A1E